MIYIHKPINLWILGIFKLLETTCNITHEVKGMENIPEYSILVASKHQSAFETFALFFYINKSIFIHKKQLFFIPIFGQYLKKTNMISINRSEGIASMRKMIKKAKSKMSAGYSIIIFPEGTRKIPGDKPDYKTGFIGIYNETESEILPVAVNSGCCWPKHTFVKTPGKIIIKILNPIPANLKKDEILKKVESVIEEETNKII
jgi:1-acyl-sn-glycerol-3-phosphate acyltransferase